MRVVQPQGNRGSLKWIQLAINRHSEHLNRIVQEACGLAPDEVIEWVSPLEEDQWAEYRDTAFLDRLRVQLPVRPLREFWPRRGPQWDALGRTNQGDVLLVEAKANIPELESSCQAKSPASLARIRASLKEVQCFLKVDHGIDWTTKLYQYANRLAHLYLLRELNHVSAHLLFLYFVGDDEVDGPQTVREWEAALSVVKLVLGLPSRHRQSDYVSDVFLDIRDVSRPPEVA